MALCPPAKPAFKSIPEGTHIAICNMVVDLGDQDSPMYGVKHQIYLRFEVPSERINYQVDGKDHEGPGVIGQSYNFTLAEKATLRKHLEGWRGKSFADNELMDSAGNPIYDVSKVVGKACQISVGKTETGNAKIAAIIALPKGMAVPTAENELIVYDDDNKDNLRRLPDWMQEKLGKSPRPMMDPADAPYDINTANEYDDDLPF